MTYNMFGGTLALLNQSTPQIFTGVRTKSAKFGVDFRHHTPFSRRHFEVKQLVDTKGKDRV